MTAPVTNAAALLVQHPSIPAYPADSTPTSYRCPACPDVVIAGPNSPSHARHQAEALADAGMLKKPFDLTRVEVHQNLGYPPHVLIEQAERPIVNGYVMPDAAISLMERSALGRHERSDPDGPPAPHALDRTLEERLLALAAYLQQCAPFTADILRRFADEASSLRAAGPLYDLDEISQGWPAVVRVHAERELQLRGLAGQLDAEATQYVLDARWLEAQLVQGIGGRIRAVLDHAGRASTTTTTTEGQ